MFNKIQFFFYRLKYKILFSVSSFFKTDEHQELLNKVDTHLLVWNQEMVNLGTGKSVSINSMRAEDLALAANELTLAETKNKQTPHVALYLHNTEFVATEYQLPEIAMQNVAAALKYQVDELLPAYPRKLILAIDHGESREKNIALWLDQPRSEELFAAFKEQGVDLITIIPRIMLTMLTGSTNAIKHLSRQYREMDDNGALSITLDNQNLIQWSGITRSDMEDEAFLQHWEKSLDEVENKQLIDNNTFYQTADLTHLNQLRYAFFPDATRKKLKQRSRLKKGRLAIFVGVIVTLALVFPFVNNAVRYVKWEKKYLEYHKKTQEVRKMRSTVNQFEDNWGLFVDYPKVDIVQVINKLNSIIPKNSWISEFKIEDDVIEVKGYSPSAAGILQVISKQAEFEQVAFTQRTRTQNNSEHFGISFRLKNINMGAYREKYIPVR